MTENELRQKVVNLALSYVGAVKGDARHRQLIDTYNTLKPLPRGYKVTYNDNYCATAVSSWFMLAGLGNLLSPECGANEMMKANVNIFTEDDAYKPNAGDVIFYDWEDTGTGDNKGYINHVALVEKCTGGYIYTVEPNINGGRVDRKTQPVNSRYIRGFCLPNYSSMATGKVYSKAPKWVAKAITYTSVYSSDTGMVLLDAWSHLGVGNLVDVCDETDDRYYVRIAGIYFGFVNKADLVNANQPKELKGYTTTALNMRKGAGTSYTWLKTIPEKALVIITGEDKAKDGVKWYKVTYGGITGYASSRYINII